MQVSVETVANLERKLRIEVDWDTFNKKEEEQFQELSSKAQIKGFRPGKKIPMKVVKSRFGEDVRLTVASELMRETFSEALEEHHLTPANYPKFEQVQMESNKPFIYEVEFEIIPQIQLNRLEGVAIDKKVVKVMGADIDKTLERLQKQSANWNKVDRASKNDDQVVIDFDGFKEGVAFEGGKSEGYRLVLGSGSFIPGFEDQVVGMKAGDEKDIEVTFPKEYHNEDLAGQPVVFKVKVHEVQEPQLPEIDDEFAKNFGIEEGGIAGLREELAKGMAREVEDKLFNELKDDVFEKLVEANPVDLPQSMLDAEVKHIADKPVQPEGNSAEDEARKRVHLGIVFGQIVKEDGLKADPKAVTDILARRASMFEQPEMMMQFYLKNEKLMEDIKAIALEQQLVEHILTKAEVTEIEVPYNEIMAANAD